MILASENEPFQWLRGTEGNDGPPPGCPGPHPTSALVYSGLPYDLSGVSKIFLGSSLSWLGISGEFLQVRFGESGRALFQ